MDVMNLQFLRIVIFQHSFDNIQSRYNWIIAEINVLQDVMNLACSIWYKAGNKQVREFAGKFRAIPIERQAFGLIGAGSRGDLGWSL